MKLKMFFIFLLGILFDERGDTLAVTYTFSANTVISSSQMNTNFDDVEAVVNALTSANYSDDSVGKATLASDVVRSDYGLVQHTDGSLYVDLSDTNPGLELTDGGLRAKVYGLLNRTSNGIEFGRSGDVIFSTSPTAPDGWSNVSATYADRFLRISATALSTGGASSHTHGGTTGAHTLTTAQIPVHEHLRSGESNVTYVGGGYTLPGGSGSGGNFSSGDGPSGGGGSHTHTIASADNIPAYVTLIMYQKT